MDLFCLCEVWKGQNTGTRLDGRLHSLSLQGNGEAPHAALLGQSRH